MYVVTKKRPWPILRPRRCCHGKKQNKTVISGVTGCEKKRKYANVACSTFAFCFVSLPLVHLFSRNMSFSVQSDLIHTGWLRHHINTPDLTLSPRNGTSLMRRCSHLDTAKVVHSRLLRVRQLHSPLRKVARVPLRAPRALTTNHLDKTYCKAPAESPWLRHTPQHCGRHIITTWCRATTDRFQSFQVRSLVRGLVISLPQTWHEERKCDESLQTWISLCSTLTTEVIRGERVHHSHLLWVFFNQVDSAPRGHVETLISRCM